MACLDLRCGLDKVCRHVVSGSEGRGEFEGSAQCQCGDRLERDERIPQHQGVTDAVESSTPSAARELRVFRRLERLMTLAGELGHLVDHHGSRWHVNADGEGFCGEHDLYQPTHEAGLDDFLKGGHHSGVMGRDAGSIALLSGISVGAEAILIPETKTYIDKLISALQKGWHRNKTSMIVIVAEGDEAGGAYKIAEKVKEELSNIETRVTVLGHIQRGGNPTCNDRVLASRLGVAAVEAFLFCH